MPLQPRPSFIPSTRIEKPVIDFSPKPVAEPPRNSRVSQKLPKDSQIVKNSYGELVTPDGVLIPEIKETNLGVQASRDGSDYIFAALEDDNIFEININDRDTMFVKTVNEGTLKVSGFNAGEKDEDYHFMLNQKIIPLSTQPVRPISRDYLVECQIKYTPTNGDNPVFARCHILTPPCVSKDSRVTIRKMARTMISIDDMVANNTIARPMADFIIEAVGKAGKSLIISGNTGSGKELPENTPILSVRNGTVSYRPIKNIQPGLDKCFDMDGQPCNVTGKVFNGEKDVWEMTCTDGKIKYVLYSGAEHQWAVGSGKSRKNLKTLTTQQIAESDKKWFIPPARKIEFPEVETSHKPYVMGMWLSTKDPIMGKNMPSLKSYDRIAPKYEFNSIKKRKELLKGLETGNRPDMVRRIESTLGYNHWLMIESVKKLGKKTSMYCIEVDSPSKTYLHTYYNIPTHNTTFMRSLFDHIYEPGESIGVVEDLRELFVPRLNVSYLSTSPETPDNTSSRVTMEYQLRQLMRMGIDSIIIGECRGPEANTFIDACNSGARKALLTMHAESAPRTLEKLVNNCMKSATSSEQSVRRNIASGVSLIVYMEKVDGLPRVKEIIEVGDNINNDGKFQLNSLFKYYAGRGFITESSPSASIREELVKYGCNKTLRNFNII